MDRMKHPFAALLCSLILTASAQAEVVLPRLSPLAVVDAKGERTGESVTVPFGLPLELLDSGPAGGMVATVQDASGAAFTVRTTDLIAPTTAQAGLLAMAEPGRNSGLRPDMPLWDSVARARLYLQGAAADSLRPALTELPGGVFPTRGLPVFAVESAPTSIGRPVMMAGAWVPVMPEALDPTDSAALRKVVLHVLVDGSEYARDFTLESLQQVSRVVAQGDKIAGFTRQVIYDNGALRDEGEVPAAGLRAEWPEAGRGTGGTLTDALAAALDGLATRIVQGDGAAHVVLVLVGPGLGADPEALARVTAAGENLADLRGVVLVQGTPEPNPANDMVLRQMAGGTAARFLDFGGDVMGAVEGVLSTPPTGDATALATWQGKVCALAADRALPCVIAAPGVLPPVAAAEWVALPLWFVLDGAALDLVPAGMAPADARLAQSDIRACHALGQVWDVAAAGCAATAAALPDDTSSLRATLVALQGEVSARLQERDLALDDLSRKTADWDDQRITLRAEADAALARLAAVQAELNSRAETIAAQEALLSDQAASVADLTDQADALAVSVSDLEVERDAAMVDVARLGRDLDDRDAALGAARGQVAELTAGRDAALADLARTQGDLAAAVAKGEGLVSDLAALTSAQAEAEAALRQERAEWQGKADAAAQALANLSAAQGTLEGQVADLTGQLTDTTAARDQLAAQVADLTAVQANLQGQVADQTEQLTQTTAALDQSVTQVAALTVLRADLEGQVSGISMQLADTIAARDQSVLRVADLTSIQADLERQLSDLTAQHASTTGARDQLAAQVSDMTASQTELERQVSDLAGRLADATAASEQSATQVTELMAAQATLAEQVADMTRQLTDQTAARTMLERALSSAEAAAVQSATEADAAAKIALAEFMSLQADFVLAVSARDDLAAQLKLQTVRADDLEAIKGDLSLAESEIRADHASVTRQLAESKAKQAELESARLTALTEVATARAALAEADARQADLVATRTTALAEAAAAQAALAEAQAKQAELATAQTTTLAEAATAQAALAETQTAQTELATSLTVALTEAAKAKDALVEAQDKLTELDAARVAALDDAAVAQAALAEAQATTAAETATVQAALAEAQAQGVAAADRVAALERERDALAEQVATAQGDAAMIVQGLTNRLAKAEDEVARLTADLVAGAMTEDMTAPADDAVAQAVNPALKPKPRPAANLATTAKAPSQTVTAPAKPAVKVAAAPVAPAPQPLPSRKVAPASDARQLKGCQFQWVGQEGRLVCP